MREIKTTKAKLIEKDIVIKKKDAIIKALKLKTKPRSLGFYRSRFNA